MISKAEYLKKYLSKENSEQGVSGTKKKVRKKKKVPKKQSNLAILDDDVDWRALAPKHTGDSDVEEDDPDEAPVIAEFRDETLPTKWQPMAGVVEERSLHEDNSDLSPPRRSVVKYDRKKEGSPDDDDLSPVRRHNRRIDTPSDGDLSPIRRQNRRNDMPSDGDLSPIRRHNRRNDTPSDDDLSPIRRCDREKERSPDDDLSPKRRRHDSASDLSPPRKRHEYKSTSVLRKPKMEDLSPPRRSSGSLLVDKRPSGHTSPSIRRTTPPPTKKGDSRSPRRSRWDRSADLSPPRQPKEETRMASGVKAGLQSAEVLKHENALARERQEQYYKGLESDLSGKHAETVYRDKTGQKIDPKLEKVKQREEERRKMEEDTQFMEWGRGVAQSKMSENKMADDLYEMSKPLARYADDEDLEQMLKEREREGDPMLAFMKKKKLSGQGKTRPKKEKPKYKGSFPMNRFGIHPGYRWDGVDRSNGFEKTWFTRESNRKAVAVEAYMWSVEDM